VGSDVEVEATLDMGLGAAAHLFGRRTG
jgi:hypothetical protein